MELIPANRFPLNNLVFCNDDGSCALGGDCLGEREPDSLADCGHDCEDFDPLGNRDKFGERCECIPGSPNLVGKEDAVHQFLRPGVLYLQRLLVFEGIRGKGPDDRDRQEGMNVLSEARSMNHRAQLIRDSRAIEYRGRNAAR